jgi:hypothetical protein
MTAGGLERTVAGTPQGGVISPLLANIYLHAFDRGLAAPNPGVLVSYADNLVVDAVTEQQCGFLLFEGVWAFVSTISLIAVPRSKLPAASSP